MTVLACWRGERRVRYGELNLARSLGIAIICLENEYNFGVARAHGSDLAIFPGR